MARFKGNMVRHWCKVVCQREFLIRIRWLFIKVYPAPWRKREVLKKPVIKNWLFDVSSGFQSLMFVCLFVNNLLKIQSSSNFRI